MHEEFLNELKSTSNELLQRVNALSEAQLKYKVNPNVWSIHECYEHIVITEIAVYRILMQTSSADATSSVTEKIGRERMEKILLDRSRKAEAPDDVKPIGRFSSLDDLTQKFTGNRERIINGLKENTIVFDSKIIMHPVLGEMTKKDWLHFMIHHCQRHCKQIEEIRALVQTQMI